LSPLPTPRWVSRDFSVLPEAPSLKLIRDTSSFACSIRQQAGICAQVC
jgi:hypothetical protein